MKQTLYAWASIVVGCTILAAGFVFFINPYNIVPGGVYGASIVLHNLFPSIQVGTFGYMFDIPLLILSVLLLGAKLGIRTIVAALLTPLLMNTMSRLVYPTREALESLDPAQLLGGSMNMTDHLMLTCIIGAVVIGVGTGIVIRSQATTGGSDIVGDAATEICAHPFLTGHSAGGRGGSVLRTGGYRFRTGYGERLYATFVAPVILFAHFHLYHLAGHCLHD